VESFDFRPSYKCILVRAISSYLRFAKTCFCQVNLLSRYSPRYLTSSWGSYTLFIWTGGRFFFFSHSECDVDQLGSVSFHHPFLNQFWIARRMVCSFCGAMSESLSVATAAVSSAKFALIDICEVGSSSVYSRYNNGRRTVPWCTQDCLG
jgi:hypothetical protein